MNIRCQAPKPHFLATIHRHIKKSSDLRSIKVLVEGFNPEKLISFIQAMYLTYSDSGIIFHTYFFLKFMQTDIQTLSRLISFFPLAFEGQTRIQLLKDAGYYADSQQQQALAHHFLNQAIEFQRSYLTSEDYNTNESINNFAQAVSQLSRITAINKSQPDILLKVQSTDFAEVSEIPQHINQDDLKLDLKLCILSNEVYEKRDINANVVIKNSIGKPYKPVFQVFIEKQILYVVIRGTWDLIQDSIADIDIDPISYYVNDEVVYIHQGFYKSAEYVQAHLSIIVQFLIGNTFINEAI
ncbi:hypothetical protein SS50377_25665 [Spironucleus salmonicida]|nr:hypothetical protein SS50377_25665 [Spironucleus salmonicida]|eukprot:EST49436.1 Hypothetical protein SS50377_10183 [Spironucleus salmonicida]